VKILKLKRKLKLLKRENYWLSKYNSPSGIEKGKHLHVESNICLKDLVAFSFALSVHIKCTQG